MRTQKPVCQGLLQVGHVALHLLVDCMKNVVMSAAAWLLSTDQVNVVHEQVRLGDMVSGFKHPREGASPLLFDTFMHLVHCDFGRVTSVSY